MPWFFWNLLLILSRLILCREEEGGTGERLLVYRDLSPLARPLLSSMHYLPPRCRSGENGHRPRTGFSCTTDGAARRDYVSYRNAVCKFLRVLRGWWSSSTSDDPTRLMSKEEPPCPPNNSCSKYFVLWTTNCKR